MKGINWKRLFFIGGLVGGGFIIIVAILGSPSFVANHFSPDGILQNRTIQRIQKLRIILGSIGGLLLLVILIPIEKLNYYRIGEWSRSFSDTLTSIYKAIIKRKMQVTFVVYLVIFLLAFSFFFSVNFINYKSFHLPWTGDHAIFNQVMYNFTHNLSFNETRYGHKNFLAAHFIPIIILISPIYLLIKSPVAVLFVSTLAITLTGFIVAKIAEKIIRSKLAGISFFLLFVLSPPVVNLYTMGFRASILSLPLFALAILYYLDKKYIPFILATLLAFLCKEDLALVVVPFSLLSIIWRRKVKWIITPLVMGAGYFYLINGLFMPLLRGGGGFAGTKFGEFQYLGDTPIQIASNLLLHPAKSFRILFGNNKIQFYADLLRPLYYLPLLAPEFLLLPLSRWLICVLPTRDFYSSIGHWYFGPLLPFLFASSIIGIKRLGNLLIAFTKKIKATLKNPSAGKKLGSVIGSFNSRGIVLSIVVILLLSSPFTTNLGDRTFGSFRHLNELNTPFHNALNKIPKEAVVSAQNPFLAYLSSRSNLNEFPQVGNADYIVLNRNRNIWPLERGKYDIKFANLLLDSSYGVYRYFQSGDLILKQGFKRTGNRQVLKNTFGFNEKPYQAENMASDYNASVSKINFTDPLAQNHKARVGKPFYKKGSGTGNVLVFGPYTTLQSGRYKVHFWLRFEGKAEANHIATLDVSRDAGHRIKKLQVSKKDFAIPNHYKKFTIGFETAEKISQVEYRVFYYGKGNLFVDRITVEPIRMKLPHIGMVNFD